MKTKHLIISLLFFSTTTYAKYCLCESKNGNSTIVSSEVESAEACKRKITDTIIKNFDTFGFCLDKSVVNIKWKCASPEDFMAKYKDQSISCEEIRPAFSAVSMIQSIKTIDQLNNTELGTLEAPCLSKYQKELEDILLSQLDAQPVGDSRAIQIEFSNEKDLKAAIEKFAPGHYLDFVKNSSLEVNLTNDNNPFRAVSDDFTGGDDLGYTHGLKIEFKKRLDDKYTMSISYSTDLYSNTTRPQWRTNDNQDDAGRNTAIIYDSNSIDKNKDVFLKGNYNHETGKYNQFFIEENKLKAIVEIIDDENNNVFYKVGAGVHQINASKTDGNILLSSLTQQDKYHDKAGFHTYDSLKQPGRDQTRTFVEAGAGRIDNFWQTDRQRISMRSEADVSLTGVDGASYAQAGAALRYDYQNGENATAYRAQAKVQARVYSTGETQKKASVEFIIDSKRHRFGLEVARRSGDDPLYLQAHPVSYHRDEIDKANKAITDRYHVEPIENPYHYYENKSDEDTITTLYYQYKW